MISVKNLTKMYGRSKALDDVSFSVEECETVGFLGPNGAGKSTTMKILTGIIPFNSGIVKMNGFDVRDNPLSVKKQTGFLPENVPLYSYYSVLSYLRFIADIKGLKNSDKKRDVDRAIEGCGLVDVAAKRISNLSKGYRQRVGLAQALIGSPRIVILDEPTVGLDPKQILEIRDLIKGLRDKCTVLLSSHILSEVGSVCNRVIVINKGRIIASDTTENLASKLQPLNRVELSIRTNDSVEKVISEISNVAGVKSVEFSDIEENEGENKNYNIETEKDDNIIKLLTNLVSQRQWVLVGIHKTEMSLEEIFIKLVSDKSSNMDIT